MTTEALFALAIGVLAGSGIYLMLRARSFPVILGLTLLSYAVNLFLFAAGGLYTHAPALIGHVPTHADPLPQALVLTAIVIGFAMTAFMLVLALRSLGETGHDKIDDPTAGDSQ